MRTVQPILIILVLIGFPAISWFYLSSGLSWRIKAQDETLRKERLPETTFRLSGSDEELKVSAMAGYYYVIAVPRDTQEWQHLNVIHEQFSVRPDYRTLYPEAAAPMPDSLDRWINAVCVGGCVQFHNIAFAGGATAAIVDDSLYVRGRYDLSTVEQMRKMVEHLAVVLPVEKRERLELRRGESN